jgi:hypothetical protein
MFGRGRGGRFPRGGQFRVEFVIPPLSKPLVTFQQFCSSQSRQTDFKAMSYQYNEYRKEHRESHLKAFMAEHERDGWFQEKYDPVTIFETRMEQRALAQKKSAQLLENISKSINLEASEEAELPHCVGPPRFDFDVNERTILLKAVPVFMTRLEIKNQVDKIESL